MRFLILSLLSLSIFTSVLSTKINPHPRAESDDFLVQLVINISETKVPDYIIEVIYDRPVEKGVSSQNVFDLFDINHVTLNSTYDIFRLLNVSSASVFSIDGLNHTLNTINWSFTTFYTRLTNGIGLTGTPLRDALLALNIDVLNFSAGITLGEPDPWTEFIKGNFTQETMEQACAAANITLEILFEGIRNLITGELVTWGIQDLIDLSLDHNIGKPEALLLWHTLNITLEDVYNVTTFRDILGNFSERVNSQISLGILTEEPSILINQKAYEIFANEIALINIYAETLITRRMVTVSGINETTYRNIIVLRHNYLPPNSDMLTTIEVGYANENLTNCSYVTLQDNAVQSAAVVQAIFENQTFLIPRSTVNNVVVGSALVCNNAVYGLAREADRETIFLDAFAHFIPEKQESSAAAFPRVSMWLNACIFIILFASKNFLEQ